MKSHFYLDPEIVFLNHGSFGAVPKVVYADLWHWQKKMEMDSVQFLENVFPLLAKSRRVLGEFVGCNCDDLVYCPNPTHAVNAVARSLDLKPGEEVLSTNHIYGALDYTWSHICSEKGAKFIKAEIPLPISSNEEFLDIFLNGCNERTKLIFISHLTSMTACRFPIEEIMTFAHERGISVFIDGAHIPGHFPLEISELNPDFYTGACHKWMCAPKGTSFLYVKKELQNKIDPPVISWGWKTDLSDGSRFLNKHEWQGTRDMTPFLTVPSAISFMQENDWESHAEVNRNLVRETRRQILDITGTKAICPDSWLGQMASIPLPISDAQNFKRQLRDKYKIQVPVFEWEGENYLRFSFHLYNTEEDAQRLIEAIRQLQS
ncbi:MAG: aminotransferase class V-fold PLP-dependent enzyme [Candidatus Marinimicrobia bacterium]|jgi:isopenicillin-N epimerase|nr:aminotransferase class V-fold PLP-dependent enzyme [Candidatus Neomarinimicrobiota bacterium]MDP6935890.1 aminotransferase class V-fold PLP-dependent enzyme [Candidatus Neomarinimicrobiota bacterium]